MNILLNNKNYQHEFRDNKHDNNIMYKEGKIK